MLLLWAHMGGGAAAASEGYVVRSMPTVRGVRGERYGGGADATRSFGLLHIHRSLPTWGMRMRGFREPVAARMPQLTWMQPQGSVAIVLRWWKLSQLIM